MTVIQISFLVNESSETLSRFVRDTKSSISSTVIVYVISYDGHVIFRQSAIWHMSGPHRQGPTHTLSFLRLCHRMIWPSVFQDCDRRPVAGNGPNKSQK